MRGVIRRWQWKRVRAAGQKNADGRAGGGVALQRSGSCGEIRLCRQKPAQHERLRGLCSKDCIVLSAAASSMAVGICGEKACVRTPAV